jgi:hypothetical protein
LLTSLWPNKGVHLNRGSGCVHSLLKREKRRIKKENKKEKTKENEKEQKRIEKGGEKKQRRR